MTTLRIPNDAISVQYTVPQNLVILSHTTTLLEVRPPSGRASHRPQTSMLTLGSTALLNLLLVQAVQWSYAREPNGFTGPEIISMWGSIVHELGPAITYPFLHPAVNFLVEVATSETVGSIVALLLVANLVGGKPLGTDPVLVHLPDKRRSCTWSSSLCLSYTT